MATNKIKITVNAEAAPAPATNYTVAVYIRGLPGYFRYRVGTRDQAMDHFAAITSTGYRRPNDRGIFEWFAPSLIERIRIDGPGLESAYKDEFVRT